MWIRVETCARLRGVGESGGNIHRIPAGHGVVPVEFVPEGANTKTRRESSTLPTRNGSNHHDDSAFFRASRGPGTFGRHRGNVATFFML